MMPPALRTGESPQFHRLDEYVFQDLYRDLLYFEPEITVSQIYGIRGERQDGIDILADRKQNDGIEVGQCKCYAHFPPTEIRKASEEFFAYWNRWSKENVKRFILFVACDLNSRQQQDTIREQKQRFAQYGITYEAWSAAHIRNKLRPQPAVVASYFQPPEYWVQVICGMVLQPFPAISSSQATESSTLVLLSNQLDHLALRTSAEIDQHLERMRVAWREGRTSEAASALQAIKNDSAVWSILAAEVKAKLVCLEAGLELERTGDVARAKQLADEAQRFAPTVYERRLRAYIANMEMGPDTALQILAEQHDIDSLNLQAALLLDASHVDEALAVLQLDGVAVEPNAETLRLQALAHLVTKNLSQAQLDIQKALGAAPRWKSIRYAAAVINYFSALSPIVAPNVVVAWPEPVEWALVKRDDVSLNRLRTAATLFLDLAENLETSATTRHIFRIWQLACFADDPQRQDEAVALCRTLLQTDPTDYRVIAWAIARSFGFDLRKSERALNGLVASKQATVPHILALVNCYLASRRAKKAVGLLDRTRRVFQQAEADALWISVYSQALLARGSTQDALATIDSAPAHEEVEYARFLALEAVAREGGDWQSVRQYGDRRYAATKDPRVLFTVCEIMARHAQWSYVSDHADQLVNEVATATAVELAVVATYNTNQLERCLELLDTHRDHFGQQKLPTHLRRIRVYVERELGILPRALSEAEELVRDEPTIENVLALIQLRIDKGDLKGVATAARLLQQRTDVPIESLLQIAGLTKLEDQPLAVSLWHQATQQELPDNLVGEAVHLGFQLGLDRELSRLTERMIALGEQACGGVSVWTFDELIAFATKRRDQRVKVEEAYQNGTVPIHIIADIFNHPLVDLYHRALAENAYAPDPLRQFALLVRHGGRVLSSGFPSMDVPWRLNLDITAVLLAAHLDVLELIETTFNPLHIPADLLPALARMCHSLTVAQPSRLHVYRQILDLYNRGYLHIADDDVIPVDDQSRNLMEECGAEWVALLECTRRENGYLVDYLPLTKLDLNGPPSSLPQWAEQNIINCRAVVEALRQYGPLSEAEYMEALQTLGQEGSKAPSATIPVTGSRLFCDGNIPEVLADADVLAVACDRFRVHIQRTELDRVRAALKEAEANTATVAWLADLINHISQRIDTGTYTLIPAPPILQEELDKHLVNTPELRCLRTLLLFDAQLGDVIWADDRCVNSYFTRDDVPIVGINDVLERLVAVGTLSAEEYYDRLIALRAANVRFIPLTKHEIMYHLCQALVENGTVVETRGLSILRRYLGACVLQGRILQRPPLSKGTPNVQGELAFLIELPRIVLKALDDVWATEQDEQTCRARAEWLITNLYVDALSIRNLILEGGVEENALYLVALSLAEMITHAVSLGRGDTDEPIKLHTPYMQWLTNRVLLRRFDAEPHLVAAVAEALKETIFSRTELDEAVPVSLVKCVMQLWYEQLPDMLREELARDPEMMARLGIEFLTTIQIDDINFEAHAFWQAASEAINGRKVTITPVNADGEVTFQPCDDEQPKDAFRFDHPITGKSRVVSDATLGLLCDSPTEREAVVRRNRLWFDCTDDRFEQVVAEIVALNDPQRRIEEATRCVTQALVCITQTYTANCTNSRHFRTSSFCHPVPKRSCAISGSSKRVPRTHLHVMRLQPLHTC